MPGPEQEGTSREEARRIIEGENREKEILEGIAEIKQGQQTFKSFCERFPELCEGQKRLEQKVNSIEPKPSEPQHLFIGPKETKHTALTDLLTCCDSDDPGSCSTPNLCASIPASLQAKMLRHFCKNPACVEELKKQGFQLDGEGYRKEYTGMLGG